MADKHDVLSASSNKRLEAKDKESSDTEFSSFCRNLESIRTQVFDKRISMQTEALKKSSEAAMENLLSHLDKITQTRKNIEDQRMKAIEMKKLIETVNALEGNRTAMESEMAEQQKKINDENEKLGSLTEDLEALEKVTSAKKEKISKALTFFKERLCLRFQAFKSEDQMKVIFDKIDASNLEREFSFYTKVIDSKYIISQCEPPVLQLDAYVEELNKSNEFGRFIVKMRKAFKDIVMRENDQNIPINVLSTAAN